MNIKGRSQLSYQLIELCYITLDSNTSMYEINIAFRYITHHYRMVNGRVILILYSWVFEALSTIEREAIHYMAEGASINVGNNASSHCSHF